MFLTVHAVVATVIGENTSNAFLAFVFGFVSHFILDAIPHGDQDFGKKVFGLRLPEIKKDERFKLMAIYGGMDAFTLAVFLIFLFENFAFAQNAAVVWCIIGAILPDFLIFIYKLTETRFLTWFHKIHQFTHLVVSQRMKYDIPLKVGVVFQICVAILFIFMIVN